MIQTVAPASVVGEGGKCESSDDNRSPEAVEDMLDERTLESWESVQAAIRKADEEAYLKLQQQKQQGLDVQESGGDGDGDFVSDRVLVPNLSDAERSVCVDRSNEKQSSESPRESELGTEIPGSVAEVGDDEEIQVVQHESEAVPVFPEASIVVLPESSANSLSPCRLLLSLK